MTDLDSSVFDICRIHGDATAIVVPTIIWYRILMLHFSHFNR
ncbi:hypothetical protein ACFOKI_02955 [Sphingomonas qilianensis]|uniref:Uncharacterized protein n=1 Tax=Sphingomonas qilianensis TaxID=1736690 RepID=A0ABU9XVH0_9SPHN